MQSGNNTSQKLMQTHHSGGHALIALVNVMTVIGQPI